MNSRCLLFLVATLLLCTPQSTLGWVYEGEDLGAEAVALDANGDVLVGSFGDVSTVIKLDRQSGTELWQYNAGPRVYDLATDGAGDVAVAADLDDSFFVSKVDGGTGTELWQQVLVGSAPSGLQRAHGVAFDPNGDVVAVGFVRNANATSSTPAFTVVKFGGTTGAVLWRVEIPGGNAREVVIDAAGDVYVAGTLSNRFVVVRLDRATGGEIWRTEVLGSADRGFAFAIALGGGGRVVAAGRLSEAFNSDIAVVTLDGGTGAVDWMRRIDGPAGGSDQALSVDVDAAGDCLVAGQVDNGVTRHQPIALKLRGTSGEELWRYELVGTDTSSSVGSRFSAVVAGPAGDAFAAGFVYNINRLADFVVVRLDGSTGTVAWRNELDGSFAVDIAVDASGDPVAVGAFRHPLQHLAVVDMDGETGASGATEGRTFLAKDPGDPKKRLIKVLAKDGLIASPSPGSALDPRVTGATVRFLNPTTTEEATFFLPPGPGWKGLGNPPGDRGYRYKGGAGDACNTVSIRHRKQWKAVCRGKNGDVPFTLDEPSQGSLAASIQFGASAPQCTVFGGTVIKDEVGRFKAVKSAGGSDCP